MLEKEASDGRKAWWTSPPEEFYILLSESGNYRAELEGKKENHQYFNSLTSSEHSAIQAPEELAPTHGKLGLLTAKELAPTHGKLGLLTVKVKAGLAGSDKFRN